MSKIGEKIITVPQSVTVEVTDHAVKVRGSQGELTITMPPQIQALKEQDALHIKRADDSKRVRALHGLYRSLIANAVLGVDKAWEKRLEVVGTGYNAKMQGEDLVLKVGYSHPVTFKKAVGVTFKVEGANKIVVAGVDKQRVGEVAYQIKAIKKPDAYKGKGVRFEGERIRIKPGKKAKAA